MFYIVIMVIAVLLVVPIKNEKKTGFAKICYALSFLISFLPAGLRYGIGTDYFYTYVPYFYWIGTGKREYDEIGFNFLNKIIYDLTGDYRWLFFVASFIFLFFIYKAIWDNSENIFQSVLLIFIGQSYFYSMNLVRQALAIAIILYSYKFLKKKEIIKTLICIIIASFFHNSALIMIPILGISLLKISNNKKIGAIFLLLCFQPVFAKIALFIMEYTKYGWYYKEGLFTEEISVLLLFQNIIILILDLYYQKIYKNKITKEYKILSNINFIGTCTMVLSYNVPLIFRLVRYCNIFQILFIPKLLNLSENKVNKKVFEICILVFFLVCMIYQIIICGGEGVMPYKSIF